MPERGHKFIVAVAVCEWIALAMGAFQTSSRIALNARQLGTAHLVLGLGASVAVLGLCFREGIGRTAFWLPFASLVLSGVTGWISHGSPGLIVVHAALSHLAVALITAAAVLTSASWSQPAK